MHRKNIKGQVESCKIVALIIILHIFFVILQNYFAKNFIIGHIKKIGIYKF